MTKTKLKTSLIVLLVLAMCLLISMPVATALAEALDENNPFDCVFIQTVDELAKDKYSGELQIKAEKHLLYDINLQPLGYIYDFAVNEENGFAIIIESNDKITVPEIFFAATNPYANVPDGSWRIYNNFMLYTYFDGIDFYFADSAIKLDDKTLEELGLKSYLASSSDWTDHEDGLYYHSKVDNEYRMVKEHPQCVTIDELPSSCVPAAAANIIQFWDRYRVELIPDYTPGNLVGDAYSYNKPSNVTNELIKTNYTNMKTSATSGTSVGYFKSGMLKYAKASGYTAAFHSAMSDGKFSHDTAKQLLEAGEPLILFLSDSAYCSFEETIKNLDGVDYNVDLMHYKMKKGRHAMAGFGYRDIAYTFYGGGNFNLNFILVATGSADQPSGYFNVNDYSTIENAYGVVIR